MFNEKTEEFSKKQNKNIPVWQSPKYIEARAKAIELIESKKYGLSEGDFWILMNETKSGKMGYTGLIISHNGCLKINDNIENKINPNNFKAEINGYNNSLTYTYCDNDIFEVGEVSRDNCTNAYPYAMALKRCFDRAVLKKCKLAYAGVYSDSEAEEFSGKEDEEEQENKKAGEQVIDETKVQALKSAVEKKGLTSIQLESGLNYFGYNRIEDIKVKDYIRICDAISKTKGAK